MAIKPNGALCAILEQIIEDPASGLTFQFERMPDGRTRLCVFGDLPLGNREFIFDEQGALGATGTALVDQCRPSWLKAV
jgi:hypothetical protein